MSDLSAFPVYQRWPARHPDRIQLYSLPTPNGVKVSIALEELGLPYEGHRVDFEKAEQKSREFRSLNPYAKIPAIIDPNGPVGIPLPLFESGAIMGDEFTMADIAMLGPVRNLIGYYGARELVAFDTLENVPAWLERSLARPGVQRGVKIPAKP